jgi:hypothetical protein
MCWLGSVGRLRRWMGDREAYSLYIFRPEARFRLFCQDLTSQVYKRPGSASSARTSSLWYTRGRVLPVCMLKDTYVGSIFYASVKSALTWDQKQLFCNEKPEKWLNLMRSYCTLSEGPVVGS